MRLRESFWFWITRNYPIGQVLPRWALVLRWILFPLGTLILTKRSGYDLRTDSWIIHGVRFPDHMFHGLSYVTPPGMWQRVIKVDGDTVTLELKSEREIELAMIERHYVQAMGGRLQ